MTVLVALHAALDLLDTGNDITAMYQVPIDLSDQNVRLLDVALALARAGGARVTLLHVVHRISHASLREFRGFYQDLRRKSRRKLDAAARRFVAEGMPVRTAVVIGEPPARSCGPAAPAESTSW